jgi:hypothetical protein
MRNKLRKLGAATAIMAVVAGTSVALPDAANARWGGGWHGGGWHGGHGGWGWGGVGLGVGTGLLLGAAIAAPYYGGYYGGYGPYAYDYGYGPTYAAYGGPYGYTGGCYIRRHWVWDGYGHRVWRRVRVCH